MDFARDGLFTVDQGVGDLGRRPEGVDFEEIECGQGGANAGLAHVHFPGVEDPGDLPLRIHSGNLPQLQLAGGGQGSGHADKANLQIAVVQFLDYQIRKQLVGLFGVIGNAAALFNDPVHGAFLYSLKGKGSLVII